MRDLAVLCWALLATALVAGCGGDVETSGPRFAVQWVGEDPPRLVRLDLDAPEAASVGLVEGMVDLGRPAVSADGTRLVFAAREGEDQPRRIWSLDVEGGDRRLAVDAQEDCASPALLPDGRIAYAAVTSRPGVTPERDAAWALHVAPGTGLPGRRISFGAGHEVGPVVLLDGRILYGSWQPGGTRSASGVFLYTIHPDGTGAARVPAPDELRDPHAWAQLADGRLLATVGEVVWIRGAGGGPWTRAPAPTGAALLTEAFGPMPLRPRPRPQGHLSILDEERHHGDLLCLDARPPGVKGNVRARFRALRGTVHAGMRPATELLGSVPLASDGSFFVRLPADTSLLLDVVDDDGEVLVEGETPFWVRPNETRACIGCHENPDTAPPNRRPLAVAREPVPLLGVEGER